MRKTKVSQSKEALKSLDNNFGLTSMSDKFRLRKNMALSLSHHQHIDRPLHLKHVRTTNKDTFSGPYQLRMTLQPIGAASTGWRTRFPSHFS